MDSRHADELWAQAEANGYSGPRCMIRHMESIATSLTAVRYCALNVGRTLPGEPIDKTLLRDQELFELQCRRCHADGWTWTARAIPYSTTWIRESEAPSDTVTELTTPDPVG